MSTNPASGTSTPHIPASAAPQTTVHALLARAHSPTSTDRIFADKIQTKPLLLHPTVHTDKRALRRHIRERKKQYYLRKRKPRPLSAKEKRATGLHKLRKDEVDGPERYEVYKGLNELWNGYMLEVLGYTKAGKMVEGWEKREVGVQGQGSLLASADMHGAEVEVVRSRDGGRVGLRGIVVRETKFSFVLVREGEGSRRVGKKGSVFRVQVRLPNAETEGEERKVVFEIHGGLFEYRPVERAVRKFKWRGVEDV
jgi:ribonuclease P protein subunit POP4